MATTSPDNIKTPNAGDQYALVQDLGALADTTQAALVKRANAYTGTSAQRTAFTSTAPEGTQWTDTNGTKGTWYLRAGVWTGGDTGWVTLTPISPITGTIRARTVGRVTEIRFDLGGTLPLGDAAYSTALPVEMRPSTEGVGLTPVPAYFDPTGARSASTVYVNPGDGVLRGTAGGGPAITRVRGSQTWTNP